MNERLASELSDEIVDKFASLFLGHFNIEKLFLTKCSGGVNCAARPAGVGGNHFRRCFSRRRIFEVWLKTATLSPEGGVSKSICSTQLFALKNFPLDEIACLWRSEA